MRASRITMHGGQRMRQLTTACDPLYPWLSQPPPTPIFPDLLHLVRRPSPTLLSPVPFASVPSKRRWSG